MINLTQTSLPTSLPVIRFIALYKPVPADNKRSVLLSQYTVILFLFKLHCMFVFCPWKQQLASDILFTSSLSRDCNIILYTTLRKKKLLQVVFSSLGLCPWRTYVVIQSLASASIRVRVPVPVRVSTMF